jgi:hypothetical protein
VEMKVMGFSFYFTGEAGRYTKKLETQRNRLNKLKAIRRNVKGGHQIDTVYNMMQWKG